MSVAFGGRSAREKFWSRRQSRERIAGWCINARGRIDAARGWEDPGRWKMKDQIEGRDSDVVWKRKLLEVQVSLVGRSQKAQP
jgi:hypothetical protein